MPFGIFPETLVRDRALLDSVRNGVMRMLLRAGEVLPHFVAIDRKVNAMFIPVDGSQMHDEAYKEAMCSQFTAWAVEAGITRYAFVTEAWIAFSGDPLDTRRVSQREDRQEVVIVVGGSKGKPFSSICEILRGADGKPFDLGPEIELGAKVRGRFAGLLDAA